MPQVVAGTNPPATKVTQEALARAALQRGELAEAATAAGALVSRQPDDPAGYFLLGMAAARAGQIGKAVPLIDEAVARRPDAEYLAQLARLLIMQRRDGEALAAAERALTQSSTDPLTNDTIGCVLARLGQHEASLTPFTAAVAAAPDNLDFRYNLAAALGFTGQAAAARDHYEAILAQDPGHARAHYGLALLARHTAQSNHVERLQTALASATDPGDELRIGYALAKELEDVGRPAEAFACLSRANDAHKQTLAYDFAQDAAIFDALEALFAGPSDSMAAGSGLPCPDPIFVIGMPRTGTTLVDRILSSHPAVGSAGELQAMPLAVKRLAQTASRTIIDPETIRRSGGIEPGRIGQLYLDHAGHHRPAGAARFVDKLPANFLYVGYIARALPEARIVCLRRNPMDTVWSNYKNLFASRSAYYAYSYDLMDIARYYVRFDRLMTLWDRLFPGQVLQLRYETLVADQEPQTRRLLDHCGLAWDPACLSFHENRAAVATPSAAQVRRPLNADAVGRWRTHEAELAPIARWLTQQGVEID